MFTAKHLSFVMGMSHSPDHTYIHTHKILLLKQTFCASGGGGGAYAPHLAMDCGLMDVSFMDH